MKGLVTRLVVLLILPALHTVFVLLIYLRVESRGSTIPFLEYVRWLTYLDFPILLSLNVWVPTTNSGSALLFGTYGLFQWLLIGYWVLSWGSRRTPQDASSGPTKGPDV